MTTTTPLTQRPEWKAPADHFAKIRDAKTKQVIYDAFKTAVTAGVAKDRAGILVDVQRLRWSRREETACSG